MILYYPRKEDLFILGKITAAPQNQSILAGSNFWINFATIALNPYKTTAGKPSIFMSFSEQLYSNPQDGQHQCFVWQPMIIVIQTIITYILFIYLYFIINNGWCPDIVAFHDYILFYSLNGHRPFRLIRCFFVYPYICLVIFDNGTTIFSWSDF